MQSFNINNITCEFLCDSLIDIIDNGFSISEYKMNLYNNTISFLIFKKGSYDQYIHFKFKEISDTLEIFENYTNLKFEYLFNGYHRNCVADVLKYDGYIISFLQIIIKK